MLQINHLTVQIGKKSILQNVSFSLEDQMCGLLGPNGAGKTTLLRCLVGLMKANSGQVIKPERIGYLPQRFGAVKTLSVSEILSYYAVLKGVPKGDRKDVITDALKATNLEQEAGKKAGALSGGMLRRLGVAQAILGNPELILFDEPTAGLDPEERMRFKLLLLDLRRRGIPVLIATHIVEDVEMVCGKIMILHNGKVVSDGTPEETAALARGKVYLTKAEDAGGLLPPFFPVRGEWHDGKQWIRVVSPLEQSNRRQDPSLEDGYICAVHGIE